MMQEQREQIGFVNTGLCAGTLTLALLAGIRFLGSVRQVVTAQTGSARLGGLALIAACVLCTWLVGRMHHLLGSFLGLSLPDVPGSAVVSFLLGGRICCDWIVLGEKLSLQAMVVAVMVLTYGVVRLLVFSTAGSKQIPIERGHCANRIY